MTFRALAISALSLLTLGACVTAPSPSEVRAPQPLKPIEISRFYEGRWLEIGRLPMRLTDGCVAAATIYTEATTERVAVRDTCQAGSPQGKERAITGSGTIMDPGTNAKLRVRYLGGLITWDYWVLDRADDYSWFISADPTMKNLWIYTRKTPTPEELKDLIGRAKALGYDTDKLEFPTPPVE